MADLIAIGYPDETTAALAPIVTAIATSSRTFHRDAGNRATPRPVRVTLPGIR